ncbi:hypothetical protein B6U43_09250, partial [Ligilactobacillus salivarius]|uniref:hypothetical protein n=1 Tax=Ligilactobacillus salivarius TaxID=1624 RepID=UPI0009EFD734
GSPMQWGGGVKICYNIKRTLIKSRFFWLNIRDIISLKINKKIQLTERFLQEFWKLSFNVDYTQLLAKLQQESRFRLLMLGLSMIERQPPL